MNRPVILYWALLLALGCTGFPSKHRAVATVLFQDGEYRAAIEVLAESLRQNTEPDFPSLVVFHFKGDLEEATLASLRSKGLDVRAVDRESFLPPEWHGKYLKLAILNLTEYT